VGGAIGGLAHCNGWNGMNGTKSNVYFLGAHNFHAISVLYITVGIDFSTHTGAHSVKNNTGVV
jgi:hypothetical protein